MGIGVRKLKFRDGESIGKKKAAVKAAFLKSYIF